MKTSILLSLAFCVAICLCLIPSASADGEIVDSGTWGNLNWELDTEGTLSISGSGAMNDFDYSSSSAWRESKTTIKTVELAIGITSIGNYAFEDCSILSRVNLPDGLTAIGYRAFDGCKGLSSITIPQNVTRIEEGAFQYCTELTNIFIPSSVTSIGRAAFQSVPVVYYEGTTEQWNSAYQKNNNESFAGFLICLGDAEQTIDSGVCGDDTTWTIDNKGVLTISGSGPMKNYTLMGTKPWDRYRNSIIQICIMEGVTQIGDYAFDNHRLVKEAVIPNSVNAIGSYAFDSCIRLLNVSIPDGVINIGRGAFQSCDSLTSISIPNGITSISPYSFSHCGGLTSITIPDDVTSIGYASFDFCSSLSNITFSGNLAFIDSYAFSGCDNLTDIYYGANESRKWTMLNSSAWSLDGNNCLYNAQWHFTEAESGWDYCGQNLFWRYNSNTKTLQIKGSGEMWPARFPSPPWSNYRSDIITIIMEDGVTTIGEYAFSDCSSLKNITIPSSVTTIGDYAFSNCSSLTSFAIPSNITTIGQGTFSGCQSLASITIPSSITTISKESFAFCSSLTSVTISSGVSIIDEGVFWYCYGMTNITIPSSIETIGKDAFSKCSNLTEIYYIGAEDQWSSIIVGKNNEGLYSATIHFPDLILPSSLTTIEEEAFAEGAFTFVKLSEGTQTIGQRAFANCPNLRYIYIPAGAAVDQNAFEGVSGLTILGTRGSLSESYEPEHEVPLITTS